MTTCGAFKKHPGTMISTFSYEPFCRTTSRVLFEDGYGTIFVKVAEIWALGRHKLKNESYKKFHLALKNMIVLCTILSEH